MRLIMDGLMEEMVVAPFLSLLRGITALLSSGRQASPSCFLRLQLARQNLHFGPIVDPRTQPAFSPRTRSNVKKPCSGNSSGQSTWHHSGQVGEAESGAFTKTFAFVQPGLWTLVEHKANASRGQVLPRPIIWSVSRDKRWLCWGRLGRYPRPLLVALVICNVNPSGSTTWKPSPEAT